MNTARLEPVVCQNIERNEMSFLLVQSLNQNLYHNCHLKRIGTTVYICPLKKKKNGFSCACECECECECKCFFLMCMLCVCVFVRLCVRACVRE